MPRTASAQTIANFEAAAKRINKAGKAMQAVLGSTASALRVIGEEIMADVKASRPGAGVPRDTGALASTGRVTGPNFRLQVELTFGGAAAPYALEQHERVELHHDVGEARYLVRGLERWQPGGSAMIKALRANAAAALRRAKL